MQEPHYSLDNDRLIAVIRKRKRAEKLLNKIWGRGFPSEHNDFHNLWETNHKKMQVELQKVRTESNCLGSLITIRS